MNDENLKPVEASLEELEAGRGLILSPVDSRLREIQSAELARPAIFLSYPKIHPEGYAPTVTLRDEFMINLERKLRHDVEIQAKEVALFFLPSNGTSREDRRKILKLKQKKSPGQIARDELCRNKRKFRY